MTIPISFGAYERTGNPTLVARNCYTEEVDGPTGPALQLRERPGLASFKTVGAGPLRAAHQKDGLFSNAALILSGTTLYTLTAAGVATALTGSIPGDGLVDIDSGLDADLNSVARIATGSALYKVVDGVVTQETFPDAGNAGASSVCYHRGYWMATEAGTDKFYYLIPGGASWAPLDFASAEYQPDPLKAVRSRGDQIAFLGSSTFEPFTLSGNSSNPIEPYGGLSDDVGCRARASAVNCAGTLMFVDNTGDVRRWDGGELQIVSKPGLAKLIGDVDPDDLVAWTFAIPGHRFYVLRLGTDATWVYDLDGVGERWTTFDSLDYDFWRAQLGCNIGDTVLACDAIEPTVYRLDATRRTDVSDTFAVEFTGWIPRALTPQPLGNIVMVCDQGDAPRSGQGSSPVAQLKVSRDTGKTFGPWKERPLAATGDYGKVTRWNGLGQIPAHQDGIVRVRISDPVGRIIKALERNVP